MVHVVRFDFLTLQVDLEYAWVVGGSRHHWVILVTEIIPLLPLVDKDAQVGRVLVQSEEQLVQIVSRVWCF